MTKKKNIPEYISVKDALQICAEHHVPLKISDYNIRYWCRAHGIGKKVFGRWMVDRAKLLELLEINK